MIIRPTRAAVYLRKSLWHIPDHSISFSPFIPKSGKRPRCGYLLKARLMSMAPSFTFVNVSNAPGLGPKEAKQMRGHITKTNFAKRRQRLGQQKKLSNADQSPSPSSALITLEKRRLRHELKPVAHSLLSRMVEPAYSPVEYLLGEYRALIFPAGLGSPGSNREADWIALLHSEPALVEASMAIAIRHSPRLQRTQGIREASVRKGRAIKMINERLDTPLGLTDGVLSAVFTLTFAELLESDAEARDVHIQGLAQMIKVRRSLGNTDIPSWFGDFILYDSIGHTILSASYSNLPLINALRNEDDPKQTDVAAIRSDIEDLRQLIDKYHASMTLKQDKAAIIRYEVHRLQLKVDTLLGSQEHYIRSLHDSLQLFLSLSWPIEGPRSLYIKAENLKYALLQPHIRLCSSMQLLVWQLFVGAAATEPASEVRSWYVIRLREVVSSMRIGGQDIAMETLAAVFAPDARLLEKFKAVWDEVSFGQQ
ncbi:hypothetical protein J7337_013413 [Fusarium musae]|uniref:Uncharacterized protein n=1 Tax=Fusarium musae TaxID=1042133 RepID=A0A9P8D4G1_9HYPO|nr:hypothetical protein J7337_013413 [Fusarium musae]KAG9495178.1 hypothetical protein J7337_013413 [Fusarium musae]